MSSPPPRTGMTVFLERKILERLAGGGEAGRKVFHLRAAQGVTAMEEGAGTGPWYRRER